VHYTAATAENPLQYYQSVYQNKLILSGVTHCDLNTEPDFCTFRAATENNTPYKHVDFLPESRNYTANRDSARNTGVGPYKSVRVKVAVIVGVTLFLFIEPCVMKVFVEHICCLFNGASYIAGMWDVAA
jgi:hypothetical protein